MYVGLSFLSTKYLRPNSPDLYSLIHLLGWIILQGIVQILVCLNFKTNNSSWPEFSNTYNSFFQLQEQNIIHGKWILIYIKTN